MNIQAEVSLYPLQTQGIGEIIGSFVNDLERAGLIVRKGSMSTVLSGNVNDVFAAIGRAFTTVTDNEQAVLVLKVSNACPSDIAVEGRKTDVA